MADNFENSFTLYLSCISSDFHEIWRLDANVDSQDGHVTKSWNFTNPRWRTDAAVKNTRRSEMGKKK